MRIVICNVQNVRREEPVELGADPLDLAPTQVAPSTLRCVAVVQDGGVLDPVPTYDLEFDDLAEVVLEESYVLAINERDGAVEFALDAVLAPGHAAYHPMVSAAGPVACYRRANLVVTASDRPRLRLSGAPPATDATGEEDLDHIDSLIPIDVDGRDSWLMQGSWGELEVVKPTIRFWLSDI